MIRATAFLAAILAASPATAYAPIERPDHTAKEAICAVAVNLVAKAWAGAGHTVFVNAFSAAIGNGTQVVSASCVLGEYEARTYIVIDGQPVRVK